MCISSDDLPVVSSYVNNSFLKIAFLIKILIKTIKHTNHYSTTDHNE